MGGAGEHVEHPGSLGAVAVLREQVGVAAEGVGGAGNVEDGLRGESPDLVQQRGRHACSRGIREDAAAPGIAAIGERRKRLRGVGVFSVLAAEAVPELTAHAVELDRGAIEAAEANAAAHGVSGRCKFMAADAARAFATLSEGCDPRRCCVLADPPRTGMEASLLHEIGRFAPEAVLYVSCAPDTLRRDADLLARYGYRAETAGMLDMFPGTAHFESVTVFRRAS